MPTTEPITILVHAPGSTHVQTLGPEGRLDLLTAPGDTIRIEPTGEAYEPTTFELEAPTAGGHLQETLELPRRLARPSLRVRLTDADGRPIERAGFALFAGGTRSLFPARSWDAEARGRTTGTGPSVFELPEAVAGRALLVVRAGGGWRGGDAHYVEASRVIDVPPAGELEVAFTVELGGRLRVRARGREGRGIAADCRVLDGAGEPVDVRFVARTQYGYSVGDTLDEEVPSNVEPALKAGTYTVELSADGYAPKTLEVAVRRGETTNLDVVLDAR